MQLRPAARSLRPAGGFTLIELMVVVAIATILFSIAIPSYMTYIRQSRRTEAKTAVLVLGGLRGTAIREWLRRCRGCDAVLLGQLVHYAAEAQGPLVEFELDRVPARRFLVTRLAADRIHQRPLIPLHDLVGEVQDRLGYVLAGTERLHEDHGLVARLRVQQLESELTLVRLEEARQGDDRLGRRDLLAQILTQRLPVALRAPLGGAVVLIEEIALALQILEHAQVVVAVLPGVGDEDPDWIALRHPRESGTSAGAAKLVHPERAAASRRVPGARAGRRRSRRPRRRGLE